MTGRAAGFLGPMRDLHLTEDQARPIFGALPQISRSETEAEARSLAQCIYTNCHTLRNIVDRYESKLQKRWFKMSKLKRREILLSVWPGMAVDHRPDHVLVRKHHQGLSTGIKFPVSDGPVYDMFMMPYINQQDMCRAEPLLLMMNARGRNAPGLFADQDLAPSKFGVQSGSIMIPPFLEGYLMSFPSELVAEGYGELIAHDWNRVPSLPNSCTKYMPGFGLWILRIQDRLYNFLVKTSYSILHDLSVVDMFGPKYPVLPEPDSISANSRAVDGIVSLSNRNLEAPYVLPPQLELDRMTRLAAARSREAEDFLWALREDPGLFSLSMRETFEHQKTLFKRQPGGNVVPLAFNLNTDVYAEAANKFIRSKIADVERWSWLSKCMEQLNDLHQKYFVQAGIAPGDAMPAQVCAVLKSVDSHMQDMYRNFLDPLPDQVYYSPAVRAYIELPPGTAPGTVSFSPNLPIHVKHLTTILSSRDRVSLCFGFAERVELLLDELDHFYNDSSARKTISALVAATVADLALIAEFLPQLQFFMSKSTDSFIPHEIKFDLNDLKLEDLDALEVLHEAEAEAKGYLTKLTTALSSRTAAMAVNSMMDLPYPIGKARTKQTVEACQKAEMALDELWKVIITDAKGRGALSPRCQEILEREPYRTPKWVEVTPIVTSKVPKSADAGIVAFSSGDKDTAFVAPRASKTKAKTRGQPLVDAGIDSPEALAQPATEGSSKTAPAPTLIHVDAKSLKVFKTIFFVPSTTSQPGEVAWVNFLHAMRHIGFGLEKLGGSAWHFRPSIDYERRSICFHEPHPQAKLPYWMARRVGRRLSRAYGWDHETFVLE